jgi:hypothetical protein
MRLVHGLSDPVTPSEYPWRRRIEASGISDDAVTDLMLGRE